MNSKISKRETEILDLTSLGFTDKEIAQKVFISCYTVQDHKKNIRRKLNVRNTAASVRRAMELGLLVPIAVASTF